MKLSFLRRFAAVAAIVLSSAGLATLTAAPATAATCTVNTYEPTWVSPTVTAKGSATSCSSAADITLEVYLFMDGTQVDASWNECNSAYSCTGFASATNRTGNQQWCTSLTVWVNGGYYGNYNKCESNNW
ncbi:hypothetical protein ABZV14_05725 [Streptosporangium canum]|uniref:hypothetical protein n=1 Tax=Streptosporangium canum TaxID=324952 RepID=UPI0033BDB667